MNAGSDRLAALANAKMFDKQETSAYIQGAPHLKHPDLRALYDELTMRVFVTAKTHSETPAILDLAAGEGSATLRFLELGAHVTATDISERQTHNLRRRCQAYGERLRVRCEEIETTIQRQDELYDVVVMNSFIHHIPDYLAQVRHA